MISCQKSTGIVKLLLKSYIRTINDLFFNSIRIYPHSLVFLHPVNVKGD